MSLSEAELKERIAAYVEAGRARRKPGFDVSRYCFDKQLSFINDPFPFKTGCCSRRSGKTVASAADLIRTAFTKSGIVCLYITLSRANAKRIIWPILVEINRAHNLGGKVNESELSITFPNRSIIYISGAKDQKEIDKFRGLPLSLCYIDEAQSFRPYIQNLVDEVISKALFDYAGTLCLTGTPGPIPKGFFHSCVHSEKWSHHFWTMFDNPWLPKKSGMSADKILQREMERKGVGPDNPTIQRECFGQWATDTSVLVFQYDPDRNHYDELPALDSPWRYILGVDIGYEDADAIAVIGYNDKAKASYLVEERVDTRQGVTELAQNLLVFIERYNPDKIVMDTGGLGKKVAEELNRRFSLPILPAEKVRKLEFIEILNDAMRTKHFFAKKDSRFALDCFLVQWELDPESVDDRGDKPHIKYVGERRKISESYHSDINDAVLYGFRESLHWLYEPEPTKIIKGTPEFYKNIEKEMELAAINALEKKNQDDPWARGISTQEWDN